MSNQMNGLAVLEKEKPTLIALVGMNLPAGVNPEALVIQELEYLKQISFANADVATCVPETIVYAVKHVLKNNLTLDPMAGLVYVKTRNVKVGEVWRKALEITPSCNGLLSISYQCGKILDHKNPAVIKDANGKVVGVEFELQRANGRWEKFTYDESDFNRWAIASHKENGRKKDDAKLEKLNYANAHYTSWKGGLDPEFARAKAIRHSLKKLGTNANEKYAIKIQPTVKTIDISPEMDNESGSDEYTPVEVIPHSEEGNAVNVNDLNL